MSIKPLELPKMPRFRGGGNAEIFMELEAIRLASDMAANPNMTEEEIGRRKAEATENVKKKRKEERRREAKAKARERIEQRKAANEPAEETAKRAWRTYKAEYAKGEKAKAGKWRAYAILKARQAIDQNKADALPKALLHAAESAKRKDDKREASAYRLTSYRGGYLSEARTYRTNASATKAAETRKAQGSTPYVQRLERETEQLQEMETQAMRKTAEAGRQWKQNHRKKAQQHEAEAAGLWEAYRAAGGRHEEPKINEE